jgi:hypothetical protein
MWDFDSAFFELLRSLCPTTGNVYCNTIASSSPIHTIVIYCILRVAFQVLLRKGTILVQVLNLLAKSFYYTAVGDHQ